MRAEATGFWTRRRASSLLQRALGEEQEGVRGDSPHRAPTGGDTKRHELRMSREEKKCCISAMEMTIKGLLYGDPAFYVGVVLNTLRAPYPPPSPPRASDSIPYPFRSQNKSHS